MKNYTEGPINVAGFDIEAIVNNIINFIIAVVTANVPALKEYLNK